ncbi:hypothetical protein EE612_057337 [Oryza sativa]|nr:hypothetical protein EE612_057337 [Oryza sativa]
MPSSLALPAAASSPSLPCYDGSRPEPRRAATVRPPMPLAGSGELIGEGRRSLGKRRRRPKAVRWHELGLEIDGTH